MAYSDRFIPYRPGLDVDFAYGLCSPKSSLNGRNGDQSKRPKQDNQSPVEDSTNERLYRNALASALSPRSTTANRILPLSYSSGCLLSPTSPTIGQSGSRHQAFQPTSSPDTPTSLSRFRELPDEPQKILALPDIRNDFYCSVLDWSTKDVIAVALEAETSLWSASTGKTSRLTAGGGGANETRQSQDIYVSCLKWSPDAGMLAVGNSEGRFEFWDAQSEKCQWGASLDGKCHMDCVTWGDRSLAYCGSRMGGVHVLDPRMPRPLAVWQHERGVEVCSAAVNVDGTQLATGYLDGSVRIWCPRTGRVIQDRRAHLSAVKGLAWCPWRRNMVASGGSCSDGKVILWDAGCSSSSLGCDKNKTGFNVGGQVCCILWSSEYRELLTSQGHPNCDLKLFKVDGDSIHHQATMNYYEDRPLHLSLSPDGSVVAVASADETLTLWELFPPKPKPRRTQIQWSPLDLLSSIR